MTTGTPGTVLLRRWPARAEVVLLDRVTGAVLDATSDATAGEDGAFDRLAGSFLAVYRAGDGLFVSAGGREHPIETLHAGLRRGWVRSCLTLRRDGDRVADVRYPGRVTEIPHRMDGLAYQDDELDFALFLARRINERSRQPGLFVPLASR